MSSISKQLVTRSTRAATTSPRSFSTAARRMAGGDTGAPRSGGAANSDAFTKREEASENLYMKQREREMLQQRIAKNKQQVADDEAAMKKLEAEKK